jgi:chemotaxis protein histidine kinase CheA
MSTESALIATLTERLAQLEAALAAKTPAPKPRGRPPKAKEVPMVATPEPISADAPGAAHYRLASIDTSLCMARKLKPSGQDRHWSPVAYYESQCTSKPAEGEDVCSSCCSLRDKEMEAGKLKHWNGRVDEDPSEDALLTVSVHMIGTDWGKKCKWNSEPSPVKSTKATASATAPNDASAAKAEKAASAAAEKAAKAAAKEAEKAEKAAAKEAEKAAAKAAKAAAAAAAKAAKAAASATKTKKTEKPKSKKETVGGASVAEPAEVVNADFTMLLIDGELRVTKNGNVYELDELTQLPGDFLGRLAGTTEAPSIDTEADEVVESDAE